MAASIAEAKSLWLSRALRRQVQGPSRAATRGRRTSSKAQPPRATLAEPTVASQTVDDKFKRVREDFPILTTLAHEKPLVYLDSAATSQKPLPVLAAMEDYYRRCNANVHRGVHYLSQLATDAYEASRSKVAGFINAGSASEIVFTRGATEAINLVAYSWGGANVKEGDEIVLTAAEHHSNIVPWQMLAQRTGAVLRFAPLKGGSSSDSDGMSSSSSSPVVVDYEQLIDLIGPKTKLVAVHHVSNVLGSMAPVPAIVERARQFGARVLIDACQSVPHMPVDVQALGVDFLVASSHKLCGPTGIGFLYAPFDLLASMPPYQGGGEMIADVFLDRSTYAEPPARFEAGTPAIAEAVGFGAAVDYLQSIGMQAVHEHEIHLMEHLYRQMSTVDGLQLYGPPPPSVLSLSPSASESSSLNLGRRAALCAFNVEGIHPTDISSFLDQQHGVAIRSGHHCAQPIHQHLKVGASARASLYIYNTTQEIDTFIVALRDTVDFFSSFKS